MMIITTSEHDSNDGNHNDDNPGVLALGRLSCYIILDCVMLYYIMV